MWIMLDKLIPHTEKIEKFVVNMHDENIFEERMLADDLYFVVSRNTLTTKWKLCAPKNVALAARDIKALEEAYQRYGSELEEMYEQLKLHKNSIRIEEIKK